MKFTPSSGLRPAAGASLRSVVALRISSPARNCSAWSPANDRRCAVVHFPVSGSRAERAAVTAKANARRRRLINVLGSVVIAAGFISAVYTLHREQQIQRVEQWR